MKVTQGEPILTADGENVAAFWAVSMELRAGHFDFIPRDNRENIKAFDSAAVPIYDPIDRFTVWPHASMPDGRNYWRISENAKGEWWRDASWFAPGPSKPGPDHPAGMVAAIDQLLNANQPDFGTSQWLSYIRGYYQSLVDRENRGRR